MPKARVSGLGVVPERSSTEAARIIAGECGEAPFIPLLPRRGPGADPVGRTGAIISLVGGDFAIETVTTGWRLARAPGRDISRAQSYLSADLDAMEEQFSASTSELSFSFVGPITWAAQVEDPRGEKILRDHGALREVSSVIAQASADVGAQLRRRFPSMEIFFQIDEPLVMPASLGGISTASALKTYVALDPQFILGLWEPIFARMGGLGSRFGVNAVNGPTPLSDRLISSLLSAGCTRFFDIAQSQLLGEIIDSGVETVWLANPSWSGGRIAADVAQRVTALGFTMESSFDNVLVVPPESEMTADWERARTAWTTAQAAVDLLNDPDRLSSL